MDNLRGKLLLAALLLIPMSRVQGASPVKTTFTVNATITGGCVFGNGVATANSNAGTINFGTLGDLRNSVDVVSAVGAGSLVVTCTPGISITVALDYGLNGGSTSARYMKNSAGTTIAYQLFKDANRTNVWGTGALALAVTSFPATTQTWPIYARLISSTATPAAGVYTDTVTVTVTY